MSLFGFKSNGSLDTKTAFCDNKEDYTRVHESALAARRNGYRVDPNSETIKKLALEKGKTVEDYLKYDLGQF